MTLCLELLGGCPSFTELRGVHDWSNHDTRAMGAHGFKQTPGWAAARLSSEDVSDLGDAFDS